MSMFSRRFSIRSLLTITVVACVVFATYARLVKRHWDELARAQHLQDTTVSKVTVSRCFPAWLESFAGLQSFSHGNLESYTNSAAPQEFLAVFDYVTEISCVMSNQYAATADQNLRLYLEQAASFPHLRTLVFLGVPVDTGEFPEGLELESLRELDLHLTHVGDEYVRGLVEAAPNLRRLGLDATRIKDEALLSVSQLQFLESLSVSRTRVSDAGLENLQGTPSLREVEIKASRVSKQGLLALQAIPNLERIHVASPHIMEQDLLELRREMPGVMIEGIGQDTFERALRRF